MSEMPEDQPKLLSTKAIEALRKRTEQAAYQWDYAFKLRVVATLEALVAQIEDMGGTWHPEPILPPYEP